jgi:hypothetical protein
MSAAGWLKLAETVGPLLVGAYAGHKQKDAAAKSSQGARLQDVLPQIQALMQQTQQHSAENYAAQQQKYQSLLPLQQSIMQNAMNLLPNSAKVGGMAPSMPSMAAGPQASALPMPSIGDLESGYSRRGGGTGGAASGAAGGALTGAGLGSIVPGIGTGVGAIGGALYGGIKGAITKHAKTAPTDFSVEDARTILSRAHQQYFGAPADPATIDAAIRGQGWQPGDRWVGESGLNGILQAWQQQSGH